MTQQPPVGAGETTAPPAQRFPDGPPSRRPTDPFVLTGPSRDSPRPDPRPTDAPRSRPVASRRPAVATATAFAAVLGVAAAATGVSVRPEPAPVTAPGVVPVRLLSSAPAPSAGVGSASTPTAAIEVATPDGRSVFAVADHRWVAARGGATPRLMVEVDLTVRSGKLSYDPDLVAVFDDRGRLHANALPAGTPGELGSGRLGPGEAARGWVGFDVPRGATTVVLRSWRGESLAALRVPG